MSIYEEGDKEINSSSPLPNNKKWRTADSKVISDKIEALEGVNLSIKNNIKNKTLIASIGDSRFEGSVTNVNSWSNRGILTYAMFLTDQKYSMPISYNLAVSGYTTTQIKDSVPSVLALDPKPIACIVNGGTNDGNTVPIDVELAKTNFTTIINDLRSGGIEPILCTDFARTTASWDSDTQLTDMQLNHWLRVYCRDNGVALVDNYNAEIDELTGEVLNEYVLIDGVHPTCRGAFNKGRDIASVLNSMYPSLATTRMQSIHDVYNTTYNPTGNLIGSSGLFQGTGGTISGGATGDVADGWTGVLTNGTGTVTFSKEARIDGESGEYQVITINATTLVNFRLSKLSAVTDYDIGDILKAEGDLLIESGSSNLNNITLRLSIFDPSEIQCDGLRGNVADAFPMTSEELKGRAVTGACEIPANVTGVTLKWIGQIEAGGTAVIKIGNTTIRKV